MLTRDALFCDIIEKYDIFISDMKLSGRRKEELELIATSIRRYTRKNGFAIRAYGPGRSRALESHILFDRSYVTIHVTILKMDLVQLEIHW